MGSVYARKRSPYLWIKYHQNGRAVRESAGTKNETVARRMLRTREGDVESKANRKRTFVDAKRRIKKHLAPFFGNRRMITITTTELRAFVAKRLPTSMQPVVTFAFVTVGASTAMSCRCSGVRST